MGLRDVPFGSMFAAVLWVWICTIFIDSQFTTCRIQNSDLISYDPNWGTYNRPLDYITVHAQVVRFTHQATSETSEYFKLQAETLPSFILKFCLCTLQCFVHVRF